MFEADPLGFAGPPTDHIIDAHRSRRVIRCSTFEMAKVMRVGHFVARCGGLTGKDRYFGGFGLVILFFTRW